MDPPARQHDRPCSPLRQPEPEARGGQRLLAKFEATWAGRRAPDPRALDLVTPDLVRRLVVAGLERGWTPTVHGLPPFELDSAAIDSGPRAPASRSA